MPHDIEFQFKNTADSPGYLLGQLTLLWQRRQKRVLDPLDLTQTQLVLLAALGWLSRTSDAVTQVDIASQSNADRMMVSKVLRTLEDKGFILRKEHPTDTRAKMITLTDSGAAVLQQALRAVEQVDVAFFSLPEVALSGFNRTMVTLIDQNKDA